MKKILSVLVTLAMLVGILSSFSCVGGAKIKYSGGSGTEDDPYLISNRDDIHELRDNIINDKYSWGYKYYYKLTNDITVGYGGDYISPMFTAWESYIDKLEDYPYANVGTFKSLKTSYVFESYDAFDVSDLEVEYDPDKVIYDTLCNGQKIAVGYDGEDEYTEKFEKYIAEKTGPLFFNYTIEHSVSHRGYTEIIEDGFRYLETLDDYFFYTSYEEINISRYEGSFGISVFISNLYRKVVFSGVFDGNGHTLTFAPYKDNKNQQYLFGFLENGAEIKNLTISGNNAYLAAYVGKDCKITNCTFEEADDRDAYWTPPIARNLGTISGCTNYRRNIEGIVGQNDGIIKDCINYGEINSGNLYKSGNGTVKGCLDFSGSISDDIEGIMTQAEQETAAGDISAYRNAGLDFNEVWIMKDNSPIFRSTLETGTGDLNFDGAVNSIDTNLMKRYMSGSSVNIEYIHPLAADMDNNGKVDAIDSSLIKRQLAG